MFLFFFVFFCFQLNGTLFSSFYHFIFFVTKVFSHFLSWYKPILTFIKNSPETLSLHCPGHTKLNLISLFKILLNVFKELIFTAVVKRSQRLIYLVTMGL